MTPALLGFRSGHNEPQRQGLPYPWLIAEWRQRCATAVAGDFLLNLNRRHFIGGLQLEGDALQEAPCSENTLCKPWAETVADQVSRSNCSDAEGGGGDGAGIVHLGGPCVANRIVNYLRSGGNWFVH